MKIDRLIGILSVLLQEEKVTAPYLAEKFEVSRRTINRDIEDLCKAGIPISTVQVEPNFLIFKWTNWYVWGWCRLRKDFRMFKLNRMDKLIQTQMDVTPREVPMPDLSTEKIFPGAVNVKAVFDASMKWHLIEEFGPESFQVQDDGTLLFEHEYTDDDDLIAWMLSCRDKVMVLEPESVREELLHITSEIAKKYVKSK